MDFKKSIFSPISIIFFILQNWNFVPLNSPPAPRTTILLSVLVRLTTLGTSRKRNQSLCLYLTGLFHITSSRNTHVAARVRTSFLSKAESYSTVCVYRIFFTRLPVSERWGCFHLLALSSNAVWMVIQISLWDLVFSSLGYMPRSGTTRSYGSSTFRFLRNHRTAFHSGCTVLHSLRQCTRAPGCHILANTCYFLAGFVCLFW